MKVSLLLLSLTLLWAKSCDRTEPFTLGEPFELAIGQTRTNKATQLTLGLMDVQEDSRCPKNTNCVWEGQAVVRLMIDDQAIELTLRQGKPQEAERQVGEYRIRALELNPYPAGSKIDKAAYRLQVSVEGL